MITAIIAVSSTLIYLAGVGVTVGLGTRYDQHARHCSTPAAWVVGGIFGWPLAVPILIALLWATHVPIRKERLHLEDLSAEERTALKEEWLNES